MRYALILTLAALGISACGTMTENGRPLERVYTKAEADVTHDNGTGQFGNGVFYYRYADKQ